MASGLEQDMGIKKRNFEKFDVVKDYSDHHYAKDEIQNCFTDTGSSVYKKIMKEWKILDNNLPDSIFVRVYEERIDLLRAVIIGAQGTPYHDAIFFFDIMFPSDYPTQPPQAFHRSHGLNLNPNLYENGTVCLSLLNTWFGRGKERWNPGESTILQVLVSIQGLVLNSEPFYNEPLTFFTSESSSTSYNEKAFALSCKISLFHLQNPPQNFESFVADHFRDRAFTILRASKAYRDGSVRIGFFSDNGPSPSFEDNKIVSKKFRDSMDKLGPQLFEAFSRNGASLQNIFEKPDIERQEEIEHKIGENLSLKKISNAFHKVLGKLESLLGWKNDINKAN